MPNDAAGNKGGHSKALLVNFGDLTIEQMRNEAARMGLKLPKSNLSKSKLIGRWQQFYDSLDRQEPLESISFDVMRPLQLDYESADLDAILSSENSEGQTSDSESDDDSSASNANNTLGQLGTPYSVLVDSMFGGVSTNPLPQAPGISMAQLFNQSGQQIPMQNILPPPVNPHQKSKLKKSSALKTTKSVKKTPSKSTSRKSVRWSVSPSTSQPKRPQQPTTRRNLGLQFPPPLTQQQNLEHLMKMMQMPNPVATQPVQQPINPFGLLQMQQMQQMQQQMQQQQQMQSQLMAAFLNPNLNPTSADFVSPVDHPPSLVNTGNPPLRSSRRSGIMPANPGTTNLKITGVVSDEDMSWG